MAEAIIIDRVSNSDNWDEVCRDLRQEAAIKNVPPDQLIREILKDDYGDVFDMDEVDWGCLLDGGEPEIHPKEQEEEQPQK